MTWKKKKKIKESVQQNERYNTINLYVYSVCYYYYVYRVKK